MTFRYPTTLFIGGVRSENYRTEAWSHSEAVAKLINRLRAASPSLEYIIGSSGFTVIELPWGGRSWTVMDHDYVDASFPGPGVSTVPGWECPTCGSAECPGCEYGRGQTLSCYL